MRNRNLVSRWILPFGCLAGIALLLTGFQPFAAVDTGAAEPGEDTSRQEVTAYQADLTALGDSGVTGKATFTRTENGFNVQLNAKNLDEGTHMQHIHEGESCSEFGGVVLPLEPYPEATGGGTINYQSNELNMPENLGDRTVVVHGTNGTPVACGEINPAQEQNN